MGRNEGDEYGSMGSEWRWRERYVGESNGQGRN